MAIQKARSEFAKQSVAIEEYEARVVESSGGKSWVVVFTKIVNPLPGGDFYYVVDKRTGKITFNRGR